MKILSESKLGVGVSTQLRIAAKVMLGGPGACPPQELFF